VGDNPLKVVAITQARMGSTRLPGKIMLEAAGKSLLEHHLERLGRVRSFDEIVLATTQKSEDDVTAELGKTLGVRVLRGSEHDVLARYHGAAIESQAEIVVRVTADCPLIDPAVTDRTVRAFLDSPEPLDYVSNRLIQTFPRGLDTEVLHFAALDEAFVEATEPADREHVTLFVWRQPGRYKLLNVPSNRDYSQHRWTVDTKEDYELVTRIIESLYPNDPEFGLESGIALLDQHPGWAALNAHIHQKPVF
jgi:spore coat polysaccharide biosynthesis protein SpsF